MSSQVQEQTEITTRVHRYASGESGIRANAYLIETSAGVVAVDATLTVSDANNLRGLLDSLKRPLLAVLITHGHPDHYNGVTELVAGAELPIIATAGVDHVIRDWDAKKEEQWKPVFGDEWPTKRTFPNRIAQNGESFVFGDLIFTVHDLGPGESHHDSYWIADDGHNRLAFVGDLAFNGEHSYVSDGHTTRWLKHLENTREALEGVARIYPGHGPAGGEELFDRQRDYLERYREVVRSLANCRSTLTEADKKVLTARMVDYLPEGKINFLISAGADAVAAELASDYLPQLNETVTELITRPSIQKVAAALKEQLQHTAEPFVWSTIDLQSVTAQLPERIRSCWMFVLKKDVPSGCHYHPNSVQNMIALNGHGRSRVGGVERPMIPFGSADHSLEEKWYVIGEGVPHEFFPEDEDMTVVSFHTCEAAELEEIACGSRAKRTYEPSDADMTPKPQRQKQATESAIKEKLC